MSPRPLTAPRAFERFGRSFCPSAVRVWLRPRCSYSLVHGMSSSRVQSWRSEEHTSELQSRGHLVCRLLLEKKKKEQDHDAMQRHIQHGDDQCETVLQG